MINKRSTGRFQSLMGRATCTSVHACFWPDDEMLMSQLCKIRQLVVLGPQLSVAYVQQFCPALLCLSHAYTSWNDFQAATDLSMTLGKLDSHKMMSNWYDQNSWCLAGATGEIKRVHADACGHSCTSSFANKSSQTAAAVAQISAHVTSEAWMWKFYKSIDDKLEFE